MLLPKEHGAYAQLVVPLATALAVAGVTGPALAAAAAVVMGFLAHEPIVVLLGGRGARARREHGRSAMHWLMAASSAAAAAGLAAVWNTAPPARWGFALPLVPACVVVSAVVRGRGKSTLAEVGAALTFSLAAVPVSLAAGATPTAGLSVALPFAVIFVAATLGVRHVTLHARAADARVVRVTRAAALVVACGGTALLAWASSAAVLPWSAPAAVLPGAGAAVFLALVPAPARQLRTVGWILTAVLVTASGVLIAW